MVVLGGGGAISYGRGTPVWQDVLVVINLSLKAAPAAGMTVEVRIQAYLAQQKTPKH